MDTQPHPRLAPANVPAPLTVCFPFLGRTFGGSCRATLMLAAGLPAGITPRFIVHEAGPVSHHLAATGFPYDVLPLPPLAGDDRSRVPLLGHVTRALPALRGYLRRTGAALVHCNDGRMNVTWGPPALLAGIPLVWHQHSHYVPSRFADLFLHFASAVIGVSTYALQDLPRRARRRAQIIANPFDVDSPAPDRAQARQQLLDRHGLARDAVVVGFVGNLTEQKRPMVFVNAIERLREEDGRVVGLVFGEPREPLANSIRRFRSVRLVGFQFPIEPALAACDVLLAPAVDEGFGRALVEAMLVGTPVVAAASGGHRDIIRDRQTGLLVPPDDGPALAAAAWELLASPSMARELASTAREIARSTFSATAHAESIASVYRAVALTRRPAA
ncbi:MAG: glycosyltransferase family 4 protein [Alphaproteobacteria bacterium]|nr:glycosyltransferase family 4 protein [Alphaproteobacteria bacterium]